MRHDLLLEKNRMGRLIGPRGSTLRTLVQNTSCQVFVLDKEGPPPGYSEGQRLVVLVGSNDQITNCLETIEELMREGGRLPTPAPSQSGPPPSAPPPSGGYGPPPSTYAAQPPSYGNPYGQPSYGANYGHGGYGGAGAASYAGGYGSGAPMGGAHGGYGGGGGPPGGGVQGFGDYGGYGGGGGYAAQPGGGYPQQPAPPARYLAPPSYPPQPANNGPAHDGSAYYGSASNGQPVNPSPSSATGTFYGGAAAAAASGPGAFYGEAAAAAIAPPASQPANTAALATGAFYGGAAAGWGPTPPPPAAALGNVVIGGNLSDGATMAAASAAGFDRTFGDWPYTTEKVGDRIRAAEATPGHVRHDILVEKSKVGRIIGSKGIALKMLTNSTNCEVFVLDKEGAPIGFPPETRAVVLVGIPSTVSHALVEVNNLLNSGPRPPLPGAGAYSQHDYSGAPLPDGVELGASQDGGGVGEKRGFGAASAGDEQAGKRQCS